MTEAQQRRCLGKHNSFIVKLPSSLQTLPEGTPTNVRIAAATVYVCINGISSILSLSAAAKSIKRSLPCTRERERETYSEWITEWVGEKAQIKAPIKAQNEQLFLPSTSTWNIFMGIVWCWREFKIGEVLSLSRGDLFTVKYVHSNKKLFLLSSPLSFDSN